VHQSVCLTKQDDVQAFREKREGRCNLNINEGPSQEGGGEVRNGKKNTSDDTPRSGLWSFGGKKESPGGGLQNGENAEDSLLKGGFQKT